MGDNKPTRGNLLDIAPEDATEKENGIVIHAQQIVADEPNAELEELPKFKQRPSNPLRRHTFFGTDELINGFKYYALVDGRGQSELWREAGEQWLRERRRRKD